MNKNILIGAAILSLSLAACGVQPGTVNQPVTLDNGLMYYPTADGYIVWADYSRLTPTAFNDAEALANKLPENLKVSLLADLQRIQYTANHQDAAAMWPSGGCGTHTRATEGHQEARVTCNGAGWTGRASVTNAATHCTQDGPAARCSLTSSTPTRATAEERTSSGQVRQSRVQVWF